jgi:hypothetical protein
VRIDRHLSEYLLFQTLWALFKSCFSHPARRYYGVFDAQAVLDAWQNLPAGVLRPERNRRQHVSALLSRNEVDRDYAYNRALFKRARQGWYVFNPALQLRRRSGEGEHWVPLAEALNLRLIGETCVVTVWEMIRHQLGLPEPAPEQVPAIHCHLLERMRRRDEATQRHPGPAARGEAPPPDARTSAEEPVPQAEPVLRVPSREPRWGTRAARAKALAELARHIEETRRAREQDDKKPD